MQVEVFDGESLPFTILDGEMFSGSFQQSWKKVSYKNCVLAIGAAIKHELKQQNKGSMLNPLNMQDQ